MNTRPAFNPEEAARNNARTVELMSQPAKKFTLTPVSELIATSEQLMSVERKDTQRLYIMHNMVRMHLAVAEKRLRAAEEQGTVNPVRAEQARELAGMYAQIHGIPAQRAVARYEQIARIYAGE